MGYQALLFCPDEKLSLILRQVFGELDFAVELVQEPFAAVKKLMAQHYDAVVVDHENEQNAALLFKSARNSSSNHSSLAIALVAGQAGIAKAYRIGANLVLTKPINVEQAKGTLRVARGLLRKTSEAVAAGTPGTAVPAIPAIATPVFAASASQLDRRSAPRIMFSSVRPQEATESESVAAGEWRSEPPGAFPETIRTAMVENKPMLVTPAETPNRITMATEAELAAPESASSLALNSPIENGVVEDGVTKSPVNGEEQIGLPVSASSSARNTTSVFPSSGGSATAPATAPEAAAPTVGKNRSVESQPGPSWKRASRALSHETNLDSGFSSAAANDGAPFAGGSKGTAGMSSNKKMLIAAVIVLSLAALAYLGYGMLVKSNTIAAPQSVKLPHDSERPAAGSDSQASQMTVPSTGRPNPAIAPTSISPATAGGNSSSGQPLTVTGKAPAIKFTSNTGANVAADGAPAEVTETIKPSSRPLLVKSSGIGKGSQAEVAAPQLPAVASVNRNNLSDVVTSTSASVPKLSLAAVKISQGVSEGLLIKRIEPKYPRAALLVHAQGAVQIEATINKEGFVTHPKVLRGDPILARAALDAVNQWRYKPYYLDGVPVEIQTQITVNFRPN